MTTTLNSPSRFAAAVAEHRGAGILYRLVSVRSVADCLPLVFYTVLTNGKIAAAVLLAVYLILISVWLPFWLMSFLVTEWGVYAVAIGTVFLIGRSIIRLIAFPGASRKVITDIEGEFAKYSVRMIETATESLIDLATVFEPREQGGEKSLDNRTLHQLPGLWRRVKSFRDRVLGVFLEVLRYTYQQDTVSTLSLSTSSNHSEYANTTPSIYGPGLTRYGNNRLTGDIGTFASLTTKARMDGRDLLDRLERVLQLVDDLEQHAKPVLEGGRTSTVTEQARITAGQMKDAASELRDFVSSLKPPAVDENSIAASEDPTDAVRRKVEEQSTGSTVEVIKGALGNILPMLDPPPHDSIFGFDVLRGCMLSRFVGARQLWVRRPAGGMVDVLHFPASSRGQQPKQDSTPQPRNTKAMLYCNPNAGLIEVATGLSLNGGNVPTSDPDNANDDSWVDYYTELGIDVYVFNYAGYGRSFGTTMCVRGKPNEGDQYPGIFPRVGRIVLSALLSFQPTPDTLRADGVAVAKYLLLECGVEQLFIHGESIGGVAASGTARYLSQSALRNKLALLICDRTFCNLEAIAQRLVGDWTGYAIRGLTPMWNTDVTGDFLAATCPKVVASDAADVIISEASSLKSGIALWKELHRGIAATKGIGWIPETPLQYRMAEWENCCVNDSRYVAPSSLFRAQPPLWPRDKHVSFEEAFHFAACCKRIGKFAKTATRASPQDEEHNSKDLGDIAQQPLVVQAWITLGCCDGLTGATLGVATKRGFDATVTWLCACLVFGGQVVAERAERRTQQHQGSVSVLEVASSDFDGRPVGFQQRQQDLSAMFPIPIPVVLETLLSYLEVGDATIAKLSHEFQFVAGVLHYVQARISAPATIQSAQKSRQLQGFDDSGEGLFLNLHCGHNNPFSKDERQSLKVLLDRAVGHHNEVV